jgi:hypothetical protein
MQDEDKTTEWQGPERRGISAMKLRHVNDHLTPLAVIIVVPGLLVAPMPMRARVVAGILIGLSVVINYLLIYLMKLDIRFIGTVRVSVNYIVNIFLSWLLYAAWGPVWLLLLLMSLGVAVYQTRRDSFLAGSAIALMLLTVHWSYGDLSLLGWAVAGVQASIIVLFNLFVNGLMRIDSE